MTISPVSRWVRRSDSRLAKRIRRWARNQESVDRAVETIHLLIGVTATLLVFACIVLSEMIPI